MKKKKDILKTSIEGLKGGYHKDMGELKKSVAGERDKRLNVDVPKDIFIKAKAKATLEGLTLKELIVRYLKSYINE